MEDQVSIDDKWTTFFFAVNFSFGSEKWPWTVQTLKRIKEWETKTKKKHGSIILQELANGQEDMGTDGIAFSV